MTAESHVRRQVIGACRLGRIEISGNGVLFFFSSRRRHTRFDCDWSSDVCSSDLGNVPPVQRKMRQSICPTKRELIAPNSLTRSRRRKLTCEPVACFRYRCSRISEQDRKSVV